MLVPGAGKRPFHVLGVWGCISLTAVALDLAMVPRAHAFAIGGAGVWDTIAGTRIAYNPATGHLGNMDGGVTFQITPPPGGRPALAAEVTQAFGVWSLLGSAPITRINLVSAVRGRANITVEWGDPKTDGPGETRINGINANPLPIILDQFLTLRTDGWNLDFNGNRPTLINEYDVFGTTLHEIGHAIGLGHPANVVSVMTPQDTARQNAMGSWRTIEQGGPGEPTLPADLRDLNGDPLPPDSTPLGYRFPRLSLAEDDRHGAVTLYSAPLVTITSAATSVGSGLYLYTYNATNTSDSSSAYRTREIEIPVPNGVRVLPTTIVAPTGWTGTRTLNSVRWDFNGAGGILPTQSLHFEFIAEAPPGSPVTPSDHWFIQGLENPPGGCCDLTGEDPPISLDFNPSDFAILDGHYTYSLDSVAWNLRLLDSVLAPSLAPEPSTIALFGTALAAFGFIRRRSAKTRRTLISDQSHAPPSSFCRAHLAVKSRKTPSQKTSGNRP